MSMLDYRHQNDDILALCGAESFHGSFNLGRSLSATIYDCLQINLKFEIC